MKELLDLFLIFARIGGFTFGGGYAMLPMLQREVVENRHWATEEELMDYYAIGQCTPGIIAVNTATFIGYKVKGIAGGIVATLGVVAPSVVIITVIALLLQNFAQFDAVQHIFNGIRVCVCILILDAVIKLGKKSIVDAATLLLFLAVAAVSLFTSIPTYLLVIFAGAAGVIITALRLNGKCKIGGGKS